MTNLIIACVLAGAIGLILGFLWYHPKTFGTIWMKEAGLTEEKLQSGNMAITFGLTFLITIYMAYEMKWVNHPDKLPSFVHGMYHGIRHIGVFALGAILINSLMERKSMQYILINIGYWLLLFALIGGMLASFPSFKPPKEETTSLKMNGEAPKFIINNTINKTKNPIG